MSQSARTQVPTYSQLLVEADKPLSERKPVARGRGGKKQVPRRYHMGLEEYRKLQADITKAGKFVSPFRQGGGIYNAIVVALIELGENETHLAGQAFAKVQSILSGDHTKDASGLTAWERFESKEPRNDETGLDPFGRFMQNCKVLQRFGGANPYAWKLGQLGACIDILSNDDGTFLRLRTGIKDWVEPINEMKKRNYPGSVKGVVPGPCAFPRGSDETV